VKAAFYEQVGAAREVLQVEDVRTPEPAPGEVRVRIAWSGVNPSDVKSRAGLRSKVLPFPRVIPHSDGMGTIDAVGEGVARRIGERVWLWNAAWQRAHGTACEAVCVPQAQAVPLPDNVDGAAGACLGIPALTALHAILDNGGVAGKTVLVAGGAGAVGHYAVQFARRLGARRVIATVSTAAKAELARGAGADDVVFYRREPVTERVAEITQGRGVDRIVEVDLAANAEVDIAMLRPGGECIVYGSSTSPMPLPFFPLILKAAVLRFFIVYNLAPDERERALAVLDRLLRQGGLQHNVAGRFPLDDIAAAHEAVERGDAAGNVVIDLN
jgi:NADPH2:quinone reductase